LQLPFSQPSFTSAQSCMSNRSGQHRLNASQFAEITLRSLNCRSAKASTVPTSQGVAIVRGLATNLHETGVPTKVIQRVCRHADEGTTKKHYIHATEPGVRSGMRKLEASITREKHERR